MKIYLEASVPPNYFKSSRRSNGFESVSEKIAKIIIIDILDIPKNEVRRGVESLKEPDYITPNEGYEVTFATNNTQILLMSGKKTVDSSSSYFIEEGLIHDINTALERKSKKEYACSTSIILLLADTLFDWYAELEFSKNNDYLCNRFLEIRTQRRNTFFQSIFNGYIKGNIYNNVYIIMPTHNERMVLFDIREFGQEGDGCLSEIAIIPDKQKAFLTYKVRDVIEAEVSEYQYITTVVCHDTPS